MNIDNSTFEYLGYYGPDSFGVTYTTRVCSHTDLLACNQLDGTGSETDSTFTHDFMGTFLWGAQNMTVTGNQYFDNIMYGFDSHDVTRNIVIEYNHVSYNGDHGIICSQACSHLTIEYNVSDHNGMVPWGGPTLDAEETRQVHGIMLHRGVTDSIVEHNIVEDQPNGVGIALFDSDGDTVADNTLIDNSIGIRLSGGASYDSVLGNAVTNTTGFAPDVALVAQYGFLMFQGIQPREYNPSTNPTGNTIADNTFNLDDQGASPMRVSNSIGNSFIHNTFNLPRGPFLFEESTGNLMSANILPARQEIKVAGAPGAASSLTIVDSATPLDVWSGADSTVTFTSSTNQLFSTSPYRLPTHVTSTGSALTVPGGVKPVMVAATGMSVQPTFGMASVWAAGVAGGVSVEAYLPAPGPTLSFYLSGFSPGVQRYPVTRNGQLLGTVTANSAGRVSFSDTPRAAAGFVYEIGHVPAALPDGTYLTVGADGSTFGFGGAAFYGSTSGVHLDQPIVGAASTPDGAGYWLVASDGGIFTFGDARYYGSTGAVHLNQPIVGMASTPDGRGYWLVASDGGIFTFGDAGYYGSTGKVNLSKPIVGMASTPDGAGYWLVASDGGIFTFGDARYYGSTGKVNLSKPIVGMAPTVDGHGYRLVASDGGIFTFGDARYYGSTGAFRLKRPIVGIDSTPDGGGYWIVASDGGVFTFGDAAYAGSEGHHHLNAPMVTMVGVT